MLWEYGLLVCPIKPHCLWSLWTLSYLHCIQTLAPSSSLSMNPAISGAHGSTLTLIRINLMLRGSLSTISTLSKIPIICPILSASSGYWYSKGRPWSWTQGETKLSCSLPRTRFGLHFSSMRRAPSTDRGPSVQTWLRSSKCSKGIYNTSSTLHGASEAQSQW